MEARIATEASRVTELEDRVQDLLAQATKQADLISEKQGIIADLKKDIDKGNMIRKAITNAALRKHDILTAARYETARTIDE